MAEHGNCYTFAAARIVEITGGRVRLPADWSEVVRRYLREGSPTHGDEISPTRACVAGDLIEMRGSGPRGERDAHVAVAIDAHLAVHLDGGRGDPCRHAAEISIARLRASRLIVRVVRFTRVEEIHA